MGAKQLQVDPSNADQAHAWDGDEGAYWAAHAEHFDRSVGAYHHEFLAAAEIAPADRVLDIGCGTGQTTRDAARRAPEGHALGVDLSAAMIEYARQRAAAEEVRNARFDQADAQIHPFPVGGFDVAISRTGATFFGDMHAGVANVARALREQARLALLTWQPPPANEWFLALTGALAGGRALPQPPPDAPGPFALSDPERIHTLLAGAGFTDIAVTAMTKPMWFGTTADDAAAFTLGLLGWMLDGLDSDARTRAIEALHATVAAHETPNGVLFGSGTWLVTGRRR
jgi:SAM-dependent methyltransferase